MQSHLDTLNHISKLRPEFDSVGILCSFSDNATGEISIGKDSFALAGEFKNFKLFQGSAVYIGNRMVLTAAHNVPQFVKDGQFIESANQHWYFFSASQAGGTKICRVLEAKIHPLWQKMKQNADSSTLVNFALYNLAVLLLNTDPDIKAIPIEDVSSHEKYTDVVSVGYSSRINKDLKLEKLESDSISSQTFLPPRTAGILSTAAVLRDNRMLIAPSYPYVAKDKFDLRPIVSGMSGGAVFSKDGKLIAINATGIAGFNKEFEKHIGIDLKKIDEPDNVVICPVIYGHKDWLDQATSFLQSQMATADTLASEWFRKRKIYEDNKSLQLPVPEDSDKSLSFSIAIDASPSTVPLPLVGKKNSFTNTHIDTLHRFSKTRREFDSVGMLSYFSDDKTGETTINQRAIGFNGRFGQFYLSGSSGVYIGKRMVLTQAYNVPQFVKDGQPLKDLHQHWYFFSFNEKGERNHYRILEAKIHPLFAPNINTIEGIMQTAKYDLAVLLLDRAPDMQPALIEEISHKAYSSIVSIGYSRRIASFQEDLSSAFGRPRTAGFLSSCGVGADDLVLISPFNLVEAENKSDELSPVSSGGMGGGGLFSNEGRLVSINSATMSGFPKDVQDKLKADNVAVSPYIPGHRKWLDESMRFLQSEIPTVDALMPKWYQDRKEYENRKHSSSTEAASVQLVTPDKPKAVVLHQRKPKLGVKRKVKKFIFCPDVLPSWGIFKSTRPDASSLATKNDVRKLKI
jgi:hypothetical protein